MSPKFWTTSNSHRLFIIGSNEAARVPIDVELFRFLKFWLWPTLWPKMWFLEKVIFEPKSRPWDGKENFSGWRLSNWSWVLIWLLEPPHRAIRGCRFLGAAVKFLILFCFFEVYDWKWAKMTGVTCVQTFLPDPICIGQPC